MTLNDINEYLPARRLPDGTFANPPHWGYALKTFGDLLEWQWKRKDDSRIPTDEKELDRVLPVIAPNFEKPPEGSAKITWLGHASVLLQVGDFNILTDPVFSVRPSPSSFVGPKRYRPCPIKDVKDLPNLDAVLISHNHYDHLDEVTIRKLADAFPKAQWYLPLENVQYLPSNVDKSLVNQLDWWESKDQGQFKFTCVPAQHWSKRGIFDTNRALWGGWVVEGLKGKFYFTGDTGYCPVFKAIGQRFKEFSVSAIPIGAYEPRWFMKLQHINREEAVAIHKEVNSQTSLGIHWGTWKLTDEFYLEPRELPPAGEKEFFTLDHGASKIVPWILKKLDE